MSVAVFQRGHPAGESEGRPLGVLQHTGVRRIAAREVQDQPAPLRYTVSSGPARPNPVMMYRRPTV